MIKKHKKTIGVIMAIMLAFGGFGFQWHKINTLKEELHTKHQIELRERKTESIETKMYKDTVEEKFNELKSYKVVDGKINFKHRYNYEDDYALGLKKRISIGGFCDVYYQYDVDLSTAEIHETEKKIIIKLDKPTLNVDSLHAVKNSYQQIKSETTYNLFANKEDSRTAMQYFFESLEDRAIEDIDELYEVEKQNHLEYNAKKEVKNLVKTFVDKKVIVEYK